MPTLVDVALAADRGDIYRVLLQTLEFTPMLKDIVRTATAPPSRPGCHGGLVDVMPDSPLASPPPHPMQRCTIDSVKTPRADSERYRLGHWSIRR